MNTKETEKYQNELRNKTAQEVLSFAVDRFGHENIALASSFGAEDQVLTDMLVKINPKVCIFTLDTGRLHQETYNLITETMRHYKIKFDILFPDTKAVEEMEREYGPNLFYESVTNRKRCCDVRKVQPLNKKLALLKAWICGLRREQSVTRADINKIEWDEAHRIYKINPLVEWTEKQIWDYIKENGVPYNKLHDAGYPSIGCAPCTRAVKPGEDVRAGRWWWESPEHKECGLHKRQGQVPRGKGQAIQ